MMKLVRVYLPFLAICLIGCAVNAQLSEPSVGSEPVANALSNSSSDSLVGKVKRGVHVGSPNAIQVGGGEGLRIGPPGMGVQYGGGQVLRYGTDRFGVKIGGGEGVRFGTKNIGVQYGGGQILRWGTPGAGVKVGGGEGIRFGTRRHGVQLGTRHGLQIGRIRGAGN